MPTNTPLQSLVLTEATSSVTLSGISQNYEDLQIVVSGMTSNVNEVQLQYNGDTSALYSRTYLQGDTSTVSTASNGNGTAHLAIWSQGVTGQIATIDLMRYSSSSVFKTVLFNMNTSALVIRQVGLYRSTSAITSLRFFVSSGTMPAGTTFDIYGISPAAADTAQAFGGTEIIYTNSHVIHVFKASGTFIPYRNLTADYLVVAGGGGGGGNGGSGGGAGGLRSTVTATGGGGSLESALSLTANNTYTVTVGAGGAYDGRTITGPYPSGVNGSNSSFHTITSTGGARGTGGNASDTVASGGSGGGASVYNGNGPTTGGAGTVSQGYAGGNATNQGTFFQSAGGGGAGGIGGNPSGTTNNIGGVGGAGVSTSISGSSVTYASGGSGYGQTTATAGGGGAELSSGATNTGGGGGGHAGQVANGGSGIVIVRYAR